MKGKLCPQCEESDLCGTQDGFECPLCHYQERSQAMNDKALDEVMREFDEWFKNSFFPSREIIKESFDIFIPTACHAYAVKVLGNLIVEKIKMGEISRPLSVPREIIQAEIDRLKAEIK